jgi:hypothetical protein
MTVVPDLSAIPRTPAEHLRLALIATLSHLAEALDAADDGPARAVRQAHADVGGGVAATIWDAAVERWADDDDALPLVRLSRAGLPPLDRALLLTLGLAEEDARVSDLFGGRPTTGALTALWRMGPAGDQAAAVRAALANLADAGLAAVIDPDAPRPDQQLAIRPQLWDTLAGTPAAPACTAITPAHALPVLADYRADPCLADVIAALPGLVAAGHVLMIRGPSRNGRRTLAGAITRASGAGLMTVAPALAADPPGWRAALAIAAAAGAVPLIALDCAPGETFALPAAAIAPAAMIVVMGPRGGIRLADDRPLTTVTIPAPSAALRARHWRDTLAPQDDDDLQRIAQLRLTSGVIRRAARALGGTSPVTPERVQTAVRELHDRRLETVAARVPVGSAPEFVALDADAQAELDALVARCRHREALAAHAAAGPGGIGVRALFSGPSGVGKTLAVRRLAQRLGKDVWRIDLSSAVSKYIGETEKTLDAAFAAAEELDIVLLLDEGDALMTRRTDVGNANDRYANLETNFLLQRIEAFEGILIVTTNAAERIDKAFQRRMDVVVPFRAPDALRRYEILDRHLGEHRAVDSLVQEIAVRCTLSGGQLRNVALHARLLAIDRERPIGDAELRAAIEREYRKQETSCPLKPQLTAVG